MPRSRPPKSKLRRERELLGGPVEHPASRMATGRPGGTPGHRSPTLEPLGDPPSTAPARVRHWWRETAADMPHLSRRERHAVLDYSRKLVEQESLAKAVKRDGRFDTLDDGRKVPSGPYKSLLDCEASLHRMRKDFASLPGTRMRAREAVVADEPSEGPADVCSPMAALRLVD